VTGRASDAHRQYDPDDSTPPADGGDPGNVDACAGGAGGKVSAADATAVSSAAVSSAR
jgi:hypothetical protein